jgi:hypothetical protein
MTDSMSHSMSVVAERVGFEPTETCASTVFKLALHRTVTSVDVRTMPEVRHGAPNSLSTSMSARYNVGGGISAEPNRLLARAVLVADTSGSGALRLEADMSRGSRAPSSKLRFDVFTRDGFRCVYCGRSPADGAVLEADHLLAWVDGGETTLENLVTACQDCNAGKHANRADVDRLPHRDASGRGLLDPAPGRGDRALPRLRDLPPD